MNTASHIKELRTKKGWTQEDLAEKTGISVRTIQRIEQGTVTPRPSSLNLIAFALDVTPDELLDNDEPINEQPITNPQTQKDWLWLPILHFSGLFLLLIPPMIIWAVKRQVDGMNKAGADVINFQLTMLVILIPAGILAFTGRTIPVCIFIGVYSTVVIIYNTIRVIGNLPCRYPLTYQFIKL